MEGAGGRPAPPDPPLVQGSGLRRDQVQPQEGLQSSMNHGRLVPGPPVRVVQFAACGRVVYSSLNQTQMLGMTFRLEAK